MKDFNVIENNKCNKSMLFSNYQEALKDDGFKKLVSKLDLSNEELMKYTSQLQDSCLELNNCKGCKSLKECRNQINGYVYFPNVLQNRLVISYEACKYQKALQEEMKHLKNVSISYMPGYIKDAGFKSIYVDDKNRLPIIKYIKSYYDDFFDKRSKGLYLSGSFGSGKTYLVAALFNELAKKDVLSSVVYFPEFLRDLKAGFDDNSYNQKFDSIKKSPLLLLDDIGAEVVTSWSRDEILGPILQYRMEENLPTFFTSNLTLDELEKHLSISNNKVEVVKARRIIERIKFLTEEMSLVSVNRRNNQNID